MRKIIQAISSQPWLIQEESLENIIAIAEGYGQDIQALEKKIGKPLDNTRKVTARGETAIIPVIGPIFRYANLFTEISGATSTEVLAKDFATAEEDPDIERIVVMIDSPGGQAPGIADMATLISNSSKPVIAHIGGIGASAAYWIASAADEVVISKSAEAGSIGAVFATYVGENKNQLTIVSKQSPKKRLDPKTEKGLADLQERIDNIAQVFVEDVANYRGVSVDTVLSDFGQGGLLLGQAAVDAGLADRVGTFESLFEEEETMAEKTGITLESLSASNPELVQAIEKRGYDSGFLAGVEQGKKDEVDRIQGVREQSIPGHEAMVEEMMFDGKTTGPEAAVAIVQAEKKIKGDALDDFRKSAPPVVADVDTDAIEDTKKDLSKLPFEERVKAEWDADEKTRADFAEDYEAYEAYRKHEEAA